MERWTYHLSTFLVLPCATSFLLSVMSHCEFVPIVLICQMSLTPSGSFKNTHFMVNPGFKFNISAPSLPLSTPYCSEEVQRTHDSPDQYWNSTKQGFK